MSEHCGTCSMCCKLPAISKEELGHDKPAGKWCKDCKPGKGCQIYDDRPKICRTYECVWLQSHTRRENQGLPIELRPDKSKVLIQPTVTGKGLVLRVLPENWDAWKKGPLRRWLSAVIEQSNYPLEIFATCTDGILFAALTPAAQQFVEQHQPTKE